MTPRPTSADLADYDIDNTAYYDLCRLLRKRGSYKADDVVACFYKGDWCSQDRISIRTRDGAWLANIKNNGMDVQDGHGDTIRPIIAAMLDLVRGN